MTENRISIVPDACNGRPIITGTRISVQTILEFLGAGDSIETENDFSLLFEKYYSNPEFTRNVGEKAHAFVQDRAGASIKIVNVIYEILNKGSLNG